MDRTLRRSHLARWHEANLAVTPADRVKILRDAYAKTIADPKLLAEAARQGWEVNPTSGEELQASSKAVMAQPREIIERMKRVLGRE